MELIDSAANGKRPWSLHFFSNWSVSASLNLSSIFSLHVWRCCPIIKNARNNIRTVSMSTWKGSRQGLGTTIYGIGAVGCECSWARMRMILGILLMPRMLTEIIGTIHVMINDKPAPVLKGNAFCFHSLPAKTGFPVHING